MVDVARGSRVGVTYAMEDSWATLPTTHVPKDLRVTGIGVNLTKDSFQSNELRSDRQIADLRHGIFSVSGDIPIEISYGAFDDIIESAMYNEWSSSNTIDVGTTERSFTLQKHFSDIGQYHVFPGCIVNSWSLNITPNGIITSTFNVMGETMSVATTTHWNAVVSAAPSNAPMDSFSGYFKESKYGEALATNSVVTGIDLTIANNISPLQVLGQNKSVGMVDGRANITGSMTCYFQDSTMLNRFIAEETAIIEFQLSDVVGNKLTFNMPKVKYSGGDVPVSGEGPIILSMPFQALYDSVTGNSLEITRTAA